MATYQIQIDDKAISEQIEKILDHVLAVELRNRYTSTNKEISQAVKDLIYSHKDEIINMVVDRATKEIVRKGLPKLLEKGGD